MSFILIQRLSVLTMVGSILLFTLSALADEHDHAHHIAEISTHADATGESMAGASKVSYKYVCPMHPQIIRDHEGACPICGMDLVKQAFEHDMQAPTISSGGGQQGLKQGLAIRTAQVQRTTLWKYIATFGRVVADQSRVRHIHPWSTGWIKNLAVRSDGEKVAKGELLYELYSPEIVLAQQDLILAAQSQQRLGKKASSLLESARERLNLLGLQKQTIRRIEKRQTPIKWVPIYAQQDGIVSKLVVQNGMYVSPSMAMMTLSDLSQVWVEAEVLPLQQDWIDTGLTANITTMAYPDERWESQIEYIYPDIDTRTQAVKVRLPLLNNDEKLKLNMLADIEIYGGPKRDALAIPMEAVIDDGMRKRVVKQVNDGQFQVSEVVTGIETKGVVEILAGIEDGERVVVSGQFLIDSESQIQENLRRLISGGASEGVSDADVSASSGASSESAVQNDLVDHSSHNH